MLGFLESPKQPNNTEEVKVCECQTPKQSLFPDGKYYCLNCWNEWYH